MDGYFQDTAVAFYEERVVVFIVISYLTVFVVAALYGRIVTVVARVVFCNIIDLALTCLTHQQDSFLQFVGGPSELIETERLEQVVYGIYLITFYRIFGVGCGKDDEWWGCQTSDEVHAVEVWHVNVAENGVYRVAVEKAPGFYGALARGYKMEKGYFTDIDSQLLQGQWLVIDS